MEQPLEQFRSLFRHGVGLPPHDALEGGYRRGQLVVCAAQHRLDGPAQVLLWVDIAVAPVRTNRLRRLGKAVPAHAVLLVQLRDHLPNLQIALIPLVGLQGGNELLHLAQSLLIVDGQQHPGLDIDQVGGHGDKLAGHLQIQFLPLGHPLEVLVQDQSDLDVLDLHFVFIQQMEDQIQRTHKILQILGFHLDHPLQVIDGAVHGRTSLPRHRNIIRKSSTPPGRRGIGPHGTAPAAPVP